MKPCPSDAYRASLSALDADALRLEFLRVARNQLGRRDMTRQYTSAWFEAVERGMTVDFLAACERAKTERAAGAKGGPVDESVPR